MTPESNRKRGLGRVFQTIALALVALVAGVGTASAQMATAVESALNTGISTTVTDMEGLLISNLPTILGFVAAILGTVFVIGLLRRFARG